MLSESQIKSICSWSFSQVSYHLIVSSPGCQCPLTAAPTSRIHLAKIGHSVEKWPWVVIRASVSSEKFEIAVALPGLKLSLWHGCAALGLDSQPYVNGSTCCCERQTIAAHTVQQLQRRLPAHVMFLPARAQGHLCGEGE